MTDVSGLSSTDASNTTITSISMAEGCAPSNVNDAFRAMLGAVHRDWERRGPTVTSGGSANTQTLTYGAAPTAYVAGDVYCFIAGYTNTGATTMNVASLGAKNVFVANAACTGGEILSGKLYAIAYDGTQFQMLSPHNTGRGGLIGCQVFTTAGTSVYTPTAGTASVVAEVCGGGGGGGGCALTGAAQCAVASPGAGGGYARKRITSAFSGVTITVGAKGTGGTAGNTGVAGGTSSFGSLVSATGGGGGFGGTATAAALSGNSCVDGGVGSSGDINAAGSSGWCAQNYSTTQVAFSIGGSSMWGTGIVTVESVTGAVGANAAGIGGGGGGASNAASQAGGHVGGDGTAGAVVVWEFN